MSDCLYSDERHIKRESPSTWTGSRSVGISLEIRDPGRLVTQEGRMELVDDGAPNPIGVEVLQESFVDTAEENEDFVILRYTISNPTGRELTNIHIGPDVQLEVESSQKAGSCWLRLAPGISAFSRMRPPILAVVVGTMPLSANAPVHFRALRYGEPQTDQSKWSYLTSGIQSPWIRSR